MIKSQIYNDYTRYVYSEGTDEMRGVCSQILWGDREHSYPLSKSTQKQD